MLIFSRMHVSGDQLNQITGVAAILRFPLPEIENEEMDDDEEIKSLEVPDRALEEVHIDDDDEPFDGWKKRRNN